MGCKIHEITVWQHYFPAMYSIHVCEYLLRQCKYNLLYEKSRSYNGVLGNCFIHDHMKFVTPVKLYISRAHELGSG